LLLISLRILRARKDDERFVLTLKGGKDAEQHRQFRKMLWTLPYHSTTARRGCVAIVHRVEYPRCKLEHGGAMEHVGAEIRRIREEKGLSQLRVALDAGMGPSALSQIENGKRNPSGRSLLKLARALDVGVADLFPKAEEPPLPFSDAAAGATLSGGGTPSSHATGDRTFLYRSPTEEEWEEFRADIAETVPEGAAEKLQEFLARLEVK